MGQESPGFWNDVQAMYADALGMRPADRGRFLDERCDGRAELRAEVESLLEAERAAAGFLPVPTGGSVSAAETPPSDDVGRTIGQCRLLEKIGEGGMGVVYRAERIDGDFRQRVALKLIDSRVGDSEVSRRFRVERQILGALQHPHIVTLLDGGVADDGRAYLVMEHVDGVPITSYCSDRRLPLELRLRLFRDVCAAVQNAHQHAIVHRDLKPANILVTADGVVKVLDFGIAKLLDAPQDRQRTMTGALQPLTPNYASPEQLRGLPVTTASDIYALGVLLYELVAGVRPYDTTDKTLDDILATVVDHDPRRPSAAQSDGADTLPYDRQRLKGDLDAIVLKAMSKEPVRRYASAQELSQDLGRHLARQPVVAREPSFAYLARTFARRHRAAVAATVVSLAALLGAMGVSLWQARVAIRERNRATARFNDVRQLANALIFKIHDQVSPLAGSTPVRKTIVAEALKYLEGLSGDPASSDELRLELAKAYHRIGDVQGKPSEPNLGDRDGALNSLEKAAALLRPLAGGPNAAREPLFELARTDLSIATVAGIAGQRERASGAVREASSIAEGLARRDPGDAGVRRMVGSALFQAALLAEGDTALRYWLRAGEVFQALLAEQPDDADRQRNVALVEKYIGDHFGRQRDSAQSLEHYSRARALDERRLRADPSNRTTQLDVAIDLANVSFQYWLRQQLTEAAAGYERTLEIRARLAESDPTDVRARRFLGYTLSQLSGVYADLSRYDVALRYAERAVDVIEKTPSVDPLYRVDLIEALWRLAFARSHTGSPSKGCAASERALAIAQELDTQAPQMHSDISGRFQVVKSHLSAAADTCGPAPARTPPTAPSGAGARR